MLRVDNLNLSISCNIPSGYCTSALLLKPQLDWLITVHNQVDTLEVKHDVNNIFFDARYGSKLMCRTLHSESRKGSAADTAQQYPTQAVAQRVAVAGVQWLNDKRAAVRPIVIDARQRWIVN